MHSSKLSDGHDPVELGAAIRNELELRGYVHQHTATWLHPQTRVKVTMGYSGGEYRLHFYAAGQVAGPPQEVVSMTRVAHIDRADTALAGWEFADRRQSA